jgi:hypothetical protein
VTTVKLVPRAWVMRACIPAEIVAEVPSGTMIAGVSRSKVTISLTIAVLRRL